MFTWVQNLNSQVERAWESITNSGNIKWLLCFGKHQNAGIRKSTGTVAEHIVHNLPCGVSCKASNWFVCGSLLTTKWINLVTWKKNPANRRGEELKEQVACCFPNNPKNDPRQWRIPWTSMNLHLFLCNLLNSLDQVWIFPDQSNGKTTPCWDFDLGHTRLF